MKLPMLTANEEEKCKFIAVIITYAEEEKRQRLLDQNNEKCHFSQNKCDT
jgi:hypothetical protein